MRAFMALFSATLVLIASGRAAGQLPCERIGEALGAPATASVELCRVNLPRRGLSVTLLGADLPTGMGLTSWAAFVATPDAAMVMGDLALTAAELPRVMAGLAEAGIDVTAVHRHMMTESPAMSFMHYHGQGDALELARGLRGALDRAPTARISSAPDRRPAGRDGVVAGTACTAIRELLGGARESTDSGPGYCKVTMPRSDLNLQVHGAAAPAAMGIASWFAFQETVDGSDAVIAGDLALTEEQVNPALRALVRSGIDVVALHNHMLFDRPTVYFFHFQARGDALELARGLRAGLEAAGLAH